MFELLKIIRYCNKKCIPDLYNYTYENSRYVVFTTRKNGFWAEVKETSKKYKERFFSMISK